VVAEREIDLKRGDTDVTFTDVPASIEPSTVQLRSTTDPAGTAVLQQNFAYDLGSPESLLSRYSRKEITAVTDGGEITGTLIAFDAANLVLETSDARHAITLVPRGEHLRHLRLDKLPEGLVTRPTLRWIVKARRPGKHRAEITYRTAGLSWAADYAATFETETGNLDLRGWVSLRNSSGVDFENAHVQLVTGKIDTPQPQPQSPAFGYPAAQPPSVQKTFALPRTITLRDREIVQVQLFDPITSAKVKRTVVYEALPNLQPYYASGYPNTDCYAFQYQASRTHGDRYVELSLPQTFQLQLPEGRARVFRKRQNEVELVGEDLLVAVGRSVRLKVGSTEQISGERRQLDCHPDDHARTMREKIELTLKNNGDTPIDVIVREQMQRWPNWTLETESEKGTRVGHAQEWRVTVPRGGQKSITYAVLYSW
jgi:hypothetical protein